MIELCCEYLSVRCIWLCAIIMSSTSFRVNLHFIVYLNIKELLARSRRHIWSLNDSNGIRTHNHFLHKGTLNHLAKLARCCHVKVLPIMIGERKKIIFRTSKTPVIILRIHLFEKDKYRKEKHKQSMVNSFQEKKVL